ncbi:hypothetical protein SU67_24885, partial [Escherichia coli O139:H28 str. E24377A]
SFLPRLIPVWLCHLAPGIPWLVHGPKILINGEQLDADPDTFSVVRWMPGSLLTWRDKNGLQPISPRQGKIMAV